MDTKHLLPLCAANLGINLSSLQSAFTCVNVAYTYGNQGWKGARRGPCVRCIYYSRRTARRNKVRKVIMACS